MTTHETLLAACLDAPDDDAARLIYADFLREQDGDAEQFLGRWIWAGVTLAPLRAAGKNADPDNVQAAAMKELMEVDARVIHGQMLTLWPEAAQTARSDNRYDEHRVAVQFGRGVTVVYRRGMIDEIRCHLTDWKSVANRVLPVAPVTLWRFAECKWLTLTMGREEYGWCAELEFDRPEQKLRGVSFTSGLSGQPVESGPAEGRAERLRKKVGIRPYRTRSGLIADLVEHGAFFRLLRHILNVVGFQALGLPDLTPETLDRLHLALEGDDLVDENGNPVRRCQHEACMAEGHACYMEASDEEPNGYYCGTHAPDHGFCAGCGLFWGGIEQFDMNPSGLCEHCAAEFDDGVDDEDLPEDIYGDDFEP